MATSHKTLDLNEAANFLRMSPSALREKAKAGRILGAKPGKKWVFSKQTLSRMSVRFILNRGKRCEWQP